MALVQRCYLAWLVSIIATLGALFVGTMRELPPTSTTWYERTLMFPLPVLLGMALFRHDFYFRVYGRWLAVAGAVVFLYHLLVYWQVAPVIKGCRVVKCDTQLTQSGEPATGLDALLTHPVLSLLAFLLIAALLSRTTQSSAA